MKPISIAILLSLIYIPSSHANEVETWPLLDAPAADQLYLPTEEKAFVDAINKFDKKAIIEQLGEPAKADDVKLKGSDRIVASIWHYHNINTAEDGTYYQTTELDFIEDKVVQVVFLNNDGSETNADSQTYEVPHDMPNDALGDGIPLFEIY